MTQTYFIGQKLEPGMFPIVDDIYRIDTTVERKWFVVHTDAASEAKVCRELTAVGIEAYTPVSAEWRKQSRREVHQKKPKVRIERPLLTSYVFAELPTDDPVCATRLADGAKSVLGAGEKRTPVPADLIDLLREREGLGEFDKTIKRGRIIAPKWAAPGREVRINDGPFSGFLAVIERCMPHDVVEIAVSIFGRSSKVQLELANVERT